MATIEAATSYNLTDFISAGNATSIVAYPKLSFIEKINTIEYPVWNVLSDYLYELKEASDLITLDEQEQLKYNYKPKVLCYDVYGCTELYYVILLLNGMCNTKEFVYTAPIKMLSIDNMSKYMSQIYGAEKSGIATYNSKTV